MRAGRLPGLPGKSRIAIMADNADRKPVLPTDRDEHEAAAAGDPLMELSLIADLDHAIAPGADAAPGIADRQIDLEEALEAELALPPVVPTAEGANARPAPAPDDAGALSQVPAFLPSRQAPRPSGGGGTASLEDELARMLGEAVADTDGPARSMVPDAAEFGSPAGDRDRSLPGDLAAIEQALAVGDDGADRQVRVDRTVPSDDGAFAAAADPVSEPRSQQAPAAPVFSRATPVASAPLWAPAVDEPAPQADAAPGADHALEAEMAAAFGDDLASGATPSEGRAAEPARHDAGSAGAMIPADAAGEAERDAADDGALQLDPFDELAVIMGLQQGDDADRPSAPAPSTSSQARSFEDMEADFQMALEQDLPDFEASARPETDLRHLSDTPPPPLDTVDMSGFEGVAPVEFDVPELEPQTGSGIDELAFADLEDELANALDDDPYRRPARPADAEPAIHGLDVAGFEAELARGMEFVGHDLNAARQEDGQGGLDLETPGETAEQVAPQRSRPTRRAILVGVFVAGLAVAGIGGVFALVGGQGAVDEGPVLVEADSDPVKVEPDDPGGTTVPNQDRAVFADRDGAAPRQESLVSTAEEPVDIATAPADVLPSTVAAGEKSEDRLTAGDTQAQAQAEPAIAPIAPRRVRTLIVRPDGTLEERPPAPDPAVSAETPAAQAASAPPTGGAVVASASEGEAPVVGEPETVAGLPADAGAAGTGDDAAALPARPERADATADQPPAPAPTAETDANGGAAQAAAAASPAIARRVQTTTATPGVIAERPANAVDRTPQAAQAPATPAPTVAGSGSDGFAVQLAALPSEEAARTTATRLSQQYGALIAGRGLTIQRAVIEGRGTFYRVRVAADGADDANGLCNRIKTSGGNCFVAR